MTEKQVDRIVKAIHESAIGVVGSVFLHTFFQATPISGPDLIVGILGGCMVGSFLRGIIKEGKEKRKKSESTKQKSLA